MNRILFYDKNQKILSIEFFFDLSVILRVFVNTDPGEIYVCVHTWLNSGIQVDI